MSKKLPDTFERTVRAFTMPDIRAEQDGGIIQGHAAVFNQATDIGGWFQEIIERGAFDNTDFRDVVLTVNHDLSKIPLARSRNNNVNSTLQLSIDSQGLFTRAKLDIENNSDAKALYSAIGRGDISGMSFIFAVREQKWENLDTDYPTRRILDIAKVYEVSAVSFPAYSGTDISARDKQALESARAALGSERSGLESSKDELEVLKLRTQILMKG
ncbi:HK97 family phage prohead protease [Paenibacillus sp. JMULE4]|uniref:HK97 family phage prohead protease n=1 Tax=Paenibacillus sp. JMULE4 TaxID=2518342 RepID=UPI001C2D89D5|nr:HK97 family phage prohead protease [Paenibacillus sp. JMULE4]